MASCSTSTGTLVIFADFSSSIALLLTVAFRTTMFLLLRVRSQYSSHPKLLRLRESRNPSFDFGFLRRTFVRVRYQRRYARLQRLGQLGQYMGLHRLPSLFDVGD